MTTATIEEAQAHLATLIAQLKPGEEVMIVERDRPVARLVGERSGKTSPRQPGSAIGKLTIVEDDDARFANAATERDRHLRTAAAGVKDLYEAGSELTEWTALDAEGFMDEHPAR